MYAAALTLVLSLAAALVLLAGVVVAAKQAAFLRASYSVNGLVVSEWLYRMHGRNRRYYRVQLKLSNGQRVELRSAVTGSPNTPPHVGETVPIRVREVDGKVSAKIGTWVELWFESFVLLFIGGVESLVMFIAIRSMRLSGAF